MSVKNVKITTDEWTWSLLTPFTQLDLKEHIFFVSLKLGNWKLIRTHYFRCTAFLNKLNQNTGFFKGLPWTSLMTPWDPRPWCEDCLQQLFSDLFSKGNKETQQLHPSSQPADYNQLSLLCDKDLIRRSIIFVLM